MDFTREVRLARPSGASLRLQLPSARVSSWSSIAFHGGREEMLLDKGIRFDMRAKKLAGDVSIEKEWKDERTSSGGNLDAKSTIWRLRETQETPAAEAMVEHVHEASIFSEDESLTTECRFRLLDSSLEVQLHCLNRDAVNTWCISPLMTAHWHISDSRGVAFRRDPKRLEIRDRGRRLTTQCDWEGFEDVLTDFRRLPQRLNPFESLFSLLLDEPDVDLFLVTVVSRGEKGIIIDPQGDWKGYLRWTLSD